jgi:ABC-2 type transport system ATP-binding protein
MAVGVRTEDLRKVYNSAPPLAASTGFIARPPIKKDPKQPKPQITALNGLTLEVRPGEIFGLLGPNGAGKSTTVGVLTTRVKATGGKAWVEITKSGPSKRRSSA